MIPLGCPMSNRPIPHPLQEQWSVTQLSPVGNASVCTETFGAHRVSDPCDVRIRHAAQGIPTAPGSSCILAVLVISVRCAPKVMHVKYQRAAIRCKPNLGVAIGHLPSRSGQPEPTNHLFRLLEGGLRLGLHWCRPGHRFPGASMYNPRPLCAQHFATEVPCLCVCVQAYR